MKKTLQILAVAISLIGLPALAQWTTQTIPLTPGWNSVHLEVQPLNDEADAVFAGLPVDSVWAWNASAAGIQFIQDPNTLVPRQAEWLTFFPASHPKVALRNLFKIQGARSYLIKLEGAQSVNWTVTGQPVVKPVNWVPDSYNLVGFPVAESIPPKFQEFLAASPAHVGQFVWKMNSAGTWDKVSNLATEPVQRGKAYWVRCNGASDYAAPVKLMFEAGQEIRFGRFLVENSLKLKNLSSNASRTVTLRTLPSAAAPAGANSPVVAGVVPLSFWQYITNSDYGFKALTNVLTITLAPQEEFTLRLAVRRPDMATFTPTAGRSALYQSLIEVTDSTGTRVLVPVSAEGSQTSSSPAAGGTGVISAAGGAANPMAGLWVGTAAITNVNQPSHPSDPEKLRPTRDQFPVRLLIHIDNAGNARLLQKVLVMWQNGTYRPDAQNPAVQVPDQPGRYVLATDEDRAAAFSGSTVRDGQQVGRRLSSAAFGFSTPILATNQNGDLHSGSLSFRVTTGFNDPVNPFRHKYHPDHDNLDERYEGVLPAGVESYEIDRAVTLNFTASDPENLRLPGWGDTQIGGEYLESLSGLHKNTLFVGGTFRLHRVSDVPVLNDGTL